MSIIKFKQWFGRAEKQYQQRHALMADSETEREEEMLRYPPFVKGFPVTAVERLLVSQAELVEKIQSSLGYPQQRFDTLVSPVLQHYAAFVHLLPASEMHHHRGAGGLLRHGLEVAFWATQASDGIIFPFSAVLSARQHCEQQWRLATCFAGLLHDVGKPLSDMSITDRDGILTWDPYLESLLAWAQRHHIQRYFIRWRDQRYKQHEQFSLLAIHRVLPFESLHYLSQSSHELLKALLEAVSGVGGNTLIGKLVAKADQESVSRDMKQSRLAGECATYGVPVERYLFDAMRRLLASGSWQVNQPGARVWHLSQGTFIAWQSGVEELLALLIADGVAGIPRDADTLADILLERGFAKACLLSLKTPDTSASFRYWQVTLPPLTGALDTREKRLLLRLESPELIFTAQLPSPLTGAILGEGTALDAPIIGTSVDSSEPANLETREVVAKGKDRLSEGHKEIEYRNGFQSLGKLIESAGEVSQVLKMALAPLTQGVGLGKVVQLVGSKAIIPFPEGAAQLGSPHEVMNALFAAGVIVPDAILPGRKIHQIAGIKALLFSASFTAAIIEAYKHLAIHSIDAASVGLADDIEVCSTDNSALKGQKPTTTSFRALSALLIRQLKQQIQQGQGNWLAAPVLQEDGELVTSDHALDRMVADYAGQFSKGELGLFINFHRKKPLMRWQSGKLYLKQGELKDV